MPKAVFLVGDNINLCPLEPDDLDDYLSWVNDQEITVFMGSGRFPVSINELKNYIDSYNNSKDGML